MKSKILLTIVILFCIAFTSNAQINKGNILLGGGVSYYSYKSAQPNYYNSYQNKSVGANIQIGKALSNNTVAGFIISYGYNKTNAVGFPDSNVTRNNQYGIGIFYRKYKKLLKDFYFFGEVDAQYIHSENSQHYLQNATDGFKSISEGGKISFVPGLSYQLCTRMQIELTMQNIMSVSYEHFKTKYNNITIAPGPYKGNDFSLNANLNSNLLSNFGIGFKFILGR